MKVPGHHWSMLQAGFLVAATSRTEQPEQQQPQPPPEHEAGSSEEAALSEVEEHKIRTLSGAVGEEIARLCRLVWPIFLPLVEQGRSGLVAERAEPGRGDGDGGGPPVPHGPPLHEGRRGGLRLLPTPLRRHGSAKWAKGQVCI